MASFSFSEVEESFTEAKEVVSGTYHGQISGKEAKVNEKILAINHSASVKVWRGTEALWRRQVGPET